MKEIEISSFFSGREVEEIARGTSLVERKSPITGLKFLLAFTTGLLNTPDGTLAQLAGFLSVACQTGVSAQAVDGRISAKAKEFMRLLMEKALSMSERTLRIGPEILAGFKHIYVTDSTNFELHASLADKFKGSGGGASMASMRIQLVFDYLAGTMHVEIGDAKLSDPKTLQRIIRERKLDMSGKCLFIQDLGYFKTATFADIAECPGKYFLSRLMFGVNIHDLQGQNIRFREILKRKPKRIDMNVMIGGLECRLVGTRLPDEVVNQRLRRANSESERKGGITDDYRIFLHYALFITNLPDAYDMNTLFLLYRIRWRIELIFKTWKSILNMHRIRSAREERVMCEVYGKLILAAFSSMICAAAEETLAWGTLISLHRAMRQMRSAAFGWAKAIMHGCGKHAQFIMDLSEQIARLCVKRNQKKRPTLEQLLSEAIMPKELKIQKKES
jgi:hypothetical protein